MKILFIYIFSYILTFSLCQTSFGFSNLLIKRNVSNQEAYDCINKLGMRIWTKVDLVNATNSTAIQKHFFIDELLEDILKFYALVYYTNKLGLIFEDKKQSILSLIESLAKSFKLAFNKVEYPELLAIFTILPKIKYTLLNKPSLKAKRNINT